jgi:uncharacterized protein
MLGPALLVPLLLAAAPDYEAAARAVVAELSTGQHAKLVQRFAPPMARALPAPQVGAAWKSVTGEAGKFQKVLSVRPTPSPPYMVMDVECAFSKKALNVRVVLDGQLTVQGLFFSPAWNPPEGVDLKAFAERPVTVGSKALPLSGTLTLPSGKGPFPAVVLVHGSGPNDADESLGPNKLFKELAWGLASRGVAVLRYHKRTFEHRGKVSNADVPTVKEETIDDALTALDALAQQKEVDPKRLFIAGHSMGAWLAPRIAAADPRVHGAVMLAASARPQWHLVVEQLEYMKSLDPAPKPELEQALLKAKESKKKLDDPALKPTDVVDGIAGTYWLDMRGYDAAKVANALDRPLLLLQGGRDYQVTTTDFEAWKKALGGKKSATLTLYPELNHHFMPGSGKSTPAEYQVLNHVPPALLEALAGWLRSN